MAAPTIADSAYQYQASTGNNPSINLPASISAGQLLVAIIHTSGTNAITLSGWTQLHQANHSSGRVAIWAVDATGSEGATKATSITSPGSVGSYVMALSGADTAASGNHVTIREALGTGTTSYTHQSMTVAVADSLGLRAHTRSGGTGPVFPGGWTSLQAIQHGTPYSFYYTADSPLASGSTGTISVSGVSDWATHGGVAIAIAPSAASAPTISSVTLSGTSQIGQTLTATVVTDMDPPTSTAYQWQKAATDDAEPGTDISGETSSTLALTYADFGDLLDTAAYVRCQAIATKNSQDSTEVASDWQAVTVAAGGGSGTSPLKLPCILD